MSSNEPGHRRLQAWRLAGWVAGLASLVAALSGLVRVTVIMGMNITRRKILVCVVTLPCSFLAVAVAWLFLAPERLYHCWDDAPPFLISWYPPFIQPEFTSLDGNSRDYYLWPEWAVYCVWFSLVALALLLPAFAAWQFGRARQSERTVRAF